jgi:hypothetical protein
LEIKSTFRRYSDHRKNFPDPAVKLPINLRLRPLVRLPVETQSSITRWTGRQFSTNAVDLFQAAAVQMNVLMIDDDTSLMLLVREYGAPDGFWVTGAKPAHDH